MSEEEEDLNDYLKNYQLAHFEEDPSNLFKTSRSKRKCLLLAFSRANLSCSNETSCTILQDKLLEYARLVDDRKGLNNFAESALSLLANTNGCKSFPSILPNRPPNITDLLEPLPGKCFNKSVKGCTATVPSPSDIQQLFTKKSISQKKPPIVAKPEFLQISSKKSLYSTYIDDKDANNGQFSNMNKRKNCLNGELKRNMFFQNKSASEDEFRKVVNHCSTKNDRCTLNKRESNPEEEETVISFNSFKTAKEQYKIDKVKKFKNDGERDTTFSQQPIRKTLGGKSKVSNRFVPPMRSNGSQEESDMKISRSTLDTNEEEVDERLRLIDPKMVELIRSEIMDSDSKIGWDDIAGLHFAKATIQEIVVWPMLRPDIFTGLRRPPKGILLFGPPGTGKTLIGKCIASQSNSTFFSISASSLTSKWIGDGEKMVRALFAVARVHQPAVVFIDEIDSLLSQRSDTEHESSRRIKTEFLVQLDGAATGEEDRILVIGATNRPQELDEAARRRLVKRLYIPLPDFEARKQLVVNLMKTERNELTPEQVEHIAKLADGFSGADMKNLCQEACLGPIRMIGPNQMFHISADQVRPVNIDDFKSALKRVKSSVSSKDLDAYIAWDNMYGSGGVQK